ncbi:MAG: UDP-3-O-(3-hydroxymyristoyl)glucosamine N-acyltransferase [Thermoanaerobaculia bacterium]
MSSRRFRLAELAELLEGRVVGEPEHAVSGVASLRDAGPEDLSFLISGRARYRREARESRAGALVVGPDPELRDELAADRPLLVVEDPELARVRVLAAFHPPEPVGPGVHPTAAVEDGAEVSPDAAVGPFAVVGRGTRIEPRAVVGAHAVVGRQCRVGPDSVLHPHVVLYDRTELGARVTLHAGTVLGADGFGYVTRGEGHRKVPQVGRVVVEDDVEIGALSAVDRATMGSTRVGAGTKVDNLVQVGHNVEIGRGAVLCGQAGIAGSSRLGDGVVLAGQAGVGGHIRLGDRVQVGAASAAVRPVAEDTVVSATVPAMEIGRWRRQATLLGRLDELFRRVKALEERAAGQGRGDGGGER